MKQLTSSLFLVCILSAPTHADSFGSGANAFNIDFVTIGNPGNAADTTGSPNPAGAVPYTYRMGKFEISEQMIDKANVLGGLAITKDSRGADKPATSVSWNEAARFVNWLNTSTGSVPAYKFAVQPGGVGYNANANIQLWTNGDAGYNPNNLFRNRFARYFLPSVDEWYKAAYYDPTNGVYYDFPTGSDTAPTAVASGTADGTAVYFQFEFTDPADVTLAGGLSPYGTMGQGGNVAEHEEAELDLVNDLSNINRGIRGGHLLNLGGELSSIVRLGAPPDSVGSAGGFRVVTIPEPSTLLLVAMAGSGLLWRRRGLRCATILAAVIGISLAPAQARADSFGSGTNAFDIKFVPIGNPGNAADDVTANPDFAGSVPYIYRIGKFEISEQMIDKANAEGGLAVTKDIRSANKPASSVSWNEAARFVNWLNTSTGNTPAYKFALQPGEVGYSANADIQLWTISDAGYDANNRYRNSLARYFLPSVDEWYKAAYYDPTSGVYGFVPTGGNTIPTAVASGTAAGTAVWNRQAGPADITLAGGLSPYGTMAQGGNVWEWEETDADLINDSAGAARIVRGGNWGTDAPGSMAKGVRVAFFPTLESSSRGFRVASTTIPEPSTLLLASLAGIGLLWRRSGSG